MRHHLEIVRWRITCGNDPQAASAVQPASRMAVDSDVRPNRLSRCFEQEHLLAGLLQESRKAFGYRIGRQTFDERVLVDRVVIAHHFGCADLCIAIGPANYGLASPGQCPSK